MSLSDLILNQPIILLAMLAALLPVFAVPVIWLAFKLRQRRRNRPPKERTRSRRRKGAKGAARSAASKRARTAEGSAATPGRAASAAPAAEAQPGAVAASAEGEAQPAAEGEAPPAAEDAPAEGTQSDEDKAADLGSEMQALLDSVFNDDEAFERLKVLLEGADTVDIHDLRSLADEVAAQLGAAPPAA